MENQIKIIKPCPICGAAAAVYMEDKIHGIFKIKIGKIMCERCGLQTPDFIIEGLGIKNQLNTLIDHWNERKEDRDG